MRRPLPRVERARPGHRRRSRWPLLVLMAGAAGLIAFLLASRRPAAVRPGGGDLAAAAESLDAATRRQDWSAAEQWAGRLAAEQPRDFDMLYALALAHHNRTTAMTPRFNRPRPALGRSLDRIAAEMRVLALLDSAAHVAATPQEWARAQLLRGMAFEGLGLPIEALEAYRGANERDPKLEGPARRIRWVSAHLADPRIADAQVGEAPARASPRSIVAPAAPPPPDSVPR